MHSLAKLGAIVTVLVLLLAGCGGPAPTQAPVTPATATQAPPTPAPVTQAPATLAPVTPAPAPVTEAPTTAPTQTATQAPTTGPSGTPIPSAPPATVACAGDGTGGNMTGELTLWHSYGSGAGSEVDALNQALAVACSENQDLKVNLVGLDFATLLDLYQAQAADGSPDLFLAPNDAMWQLAEMSNTKDVKDNLDPAKFTQLAIDGSSYTTKTGQAGIWQVPESLTSVVLYYNKDNVKTPPARTDDLMTAVENGAKIGLLGGTDILHNFGWWGAFGGKLMDDTGKCIADQGGVADALSYLQNLQAAGAKFYAQHDEMAADFTAGKLDLVVDDSGAAASYAADAPAGIGRALAVAPLPAGSADPALPLIGVDGYNINPHGPNPDLATQFATRMAQPDIQKIYADAAYHIPAATDVLPSDNEISAQLATAVQNGYPRPQTPLLTNFWGNFGDALNQVLSEGQDPQTAVADACSAMNSANGIQ